MPYINRFLQPDTIIPAPVSPQSWNRYSYAENDPINSADTSGHFKCNNGSKSLQQNETFDCQAAVESYLTLLEDKGGEEGKALVKAFREADTVTSCRRRHPQCVTQTDQITVNIFEKGKADGQYIGNKTFNLNARLLTNSNETDPLIHAGQLGHEIVHLTQEDLISKTLGVFNSSLYREIAAYDVESKIFQNMGLTRDNGTVDYAAVIAAYKVASPETILQSEWATSNNQYENLPLAAGGGRFLDNRFYVKHRIMIP